MIRDENIWIVDDDRSIRWVLEKALKGAGISTRSFEDGESALRALDRQIPDAVVTDVRMPGIDGLELMQKLHGEDPEIPVIVITAHSDLDSAVSAYQSGAFEYLPKPFDIDEAVNLVQRALKHRADQAIDVAEVEDKPTEIIGEAPAMQEVFRAIGRLSRSNITVLINGESGTGKELVAQALHRHSPRASNPFIALNMAAIPKDLMESELFGHEKGAFTGAQAQRQGRFEQASGGTLFLDEIGDMPAELQTRLLRVLADGEFFRVGGHSPIKADVRIIAATHQDLETRVEAGSFREDLFHRLNVIRVRIPALRQRREDIPLLARHFLDKAASELQVETKVLSDDAVEAMKSFDWPGNVRQLENACRWITVMASGRDIHREDLPEEVTGGSQTSRVASSDWEATLRQWAIARLASGEHRILREAIPNVERILIDVALEKTAGHKQEAAKLLGWGRNTLTRKLKELDIHV